MIRPPFRPFSAVFQPMRPPICADEGTLHSILKFFVLDVLFR
jgi:hypothetical protein